MLCAVLSVSLNEIVKLSLRCFKAFVCLNKGEKLPFMLACISLYAVCNKLVTVFGSLFDYTKVFVLIMINTIIILCLINYTMFSLL